MKGERASEREKTLKLTNIGKKKTLKSTNIGKKKNLEINQQWHLKNDDRISCNAKVADNRERESDK
jgi:hypothetical protein